MADFFPHPTPRIEATFLRRLNRFIFRFVLPDGREVEAHSPNTGSMMGLLRPGAPALLWDSRNPARRYPLSFKAILADGIWVGIDTARPNEMVHALLRDGRVTALPPFDRLVRERRVGENSRIDIYGESAGLPWYVEVKNVTLAEGNVARFPDAVTARGLKHLEELARLHREGAGTAMVYAVQREDCTSFGPASAIDPAYAGRMAEVHAAGVLIIALSFSVAPDGIRFRGELPLETF